MILRSKGGEFSIQNRSVLLEFLRGEGGMRGEEGGEKKIIRDLGIECIASVPICFSAQGGEGSAGVEWTFSTFHLDRYDERIDPEGWDFSQFLNNPVIEWAHCYSIPAIGRAEGLYTDEKGLHGAIIFNDREYDPFGWSIGERVKAGVIKAGSVGFRPIEVEIPSKEEGADGTSLIFRKQELLEFSVCNVPANPWALAKSTPLENSVSKKQETVQDDHSASREFWGGFFGDGIA